MTVLNDVITVFFIISEFIAFKVEKYGKTIIIRSTIPGKILTNIISKFFLCWTTVKILLCLLYTFIFKSKPNSAARPRPWLTICLLFTICFSLHPTSNIYIYLYLVLKHFYNISPFSSKYSLITLDYFEQVISLLKRLYFFIIIFV